jgi:hypothetical protein
VKLKQLVAETDGLIAEVVSAGYVAKLEESHALLFAQVQKAAGKTNQEIGHENIIASANLLNIQNAYERLVEARNYLVKATGASDVLVPDKTLSMYK